MDFSTEALLEYRGHIYVNGIEYAIRDIDKVLKDVKGKVVIDLIPGIQQIIVQPWMTQLNSLYNFHRNMNGGNPMPSTVMYGNMTNFSSNLYFAELSITPYSNVCWKGYIPKSAIISIGIV